MFDLTVQMRGRCQNCCFVGRQSNTVKAPYVSVGVNGLLCREPSVGLVGPGGPDLGAAYKWQNYSFYLVQLIESNGNNNAPKNAFIHAVSVRKRQLSP